MTNYNQFISIQKMGKCGLWVYCSSVGTKGENITSVNGNVSFFASKRLQNF